MNRRISLFPVARVIKWAAIGLAFMAFNLPLLYLLVDGWKVPVPFATLVTIMISIILRFIANDRFVFLHKCPSWQRLRTYVVSIALGACLWYAVANFLILFRVHYLIAAILATACSVTVNFLFNFLWVWRPAKTDPSAASPSALP